VETNSDYYYFAVTLIGLTEGSCCNCSCSTLLKFCWGW